MLLLASITMESEAAADACRIRFTEMNSAALGRSLSLAVVEPAEQAARRRPVLYLLHGRGRTHRSLVDAPAAREALLAAPFYVVLPQGEDGWYIDSPQIPEDRYEQYLREVVAWTEEHLPVRDDAAGRGIAGWSMGGYGAVRFAQQHSGWFGFVASIIGLLDFPREETLIEGQNYRVPEDRFGADRDAWRRLNPLFKIEGLRRSAVTLVLSRTGFERTMNERFLQAAEAAGVTVRVHRLGGGHEFPLVQRAVPLVFEDAAAFFSGRARSP